MTSDESCPIPEAKVAFRNIGGRVVIVDPVENKMISLNETGSFIWETLDGRNMKSIARDLGKNFDVPFDIAIKDVTEFVAELESKGLLVQAGKKDTCAE